MDAYFARLTWNENGWRRPSGPNGKREQGTYVAEHGFGHEEWLNRRDWEIGGWRYGFVQAVNRSQRRLEGQWIDLIFYAVAGGGQRVYVGELANAEVLRREQAADAVELYERSGWLATMRDEVDAAGGASSILGDITARPLELLNLRFRAPDLKMFAQPVLVPPDHRLHDLHRYRLFNVSPDDSRSFRDYTRRAPLQTERMEDVGSRPPQPATEMYLIEQQMQREIAGLLRQEFGADCVLREEDYVDIRVRGSRHLLIEVKAETVARQAIRNALGQLLFYGYRDGIPPSPIELVAIGQGPATDADLRFLETLKAQFGLEVAYHQYTVGSLELRPAISAGTPATT